MNTKTITRLVSALLCIVMLMISPLTVFAMTENSAQDAELPENDELFAYFAEEELYDYDMAVFGTRARAGLNTVEQGIYDALKPKIEAVAANGGSTVFVLPEVTALKTTWTNTELGVDSIKDTNVVEEKFNAQFNFHNIITALISDCPLDLYWFDKTVGAKESYSIGLSGYKYGSNTIYTSAAITDFTFTFTVASGYQSGNSITVTSDVAKVTDAKNMAAEIVKKYKDKPDYEKLKGYKEEICALTAYNHAASKDDNADYGDPWQLIYVFDADDTTNVVCEGYSKAFQYLCDLGGLDCICVEGVMAGGTGAGGHMWNVVTLDGGNYLVDVTNCDAGTLGAPDKLFMVGGIYANGGYIYNIGNNKITYTCDDLSLETENYTVDAAYIVSINSNGGAGVMEDETVTSGEYTLPANGFTAPYGKQFKAWAIGSINGIYKQPGDIITITDDTCIYAVWEAVPAEHICDIKPVQKVKPTCTKDGKNAYYKCEGCGKVFEDALGASEITDLASWGNIGKLGHSYSSSYTIDKAATCSAQGSKSKHCTRSGCTAKTSVTAIAKLAHTEVKIPGKAATCTKTGLTEGKKCSVCGTVTLAQKTIAKKAHTYKNYTTKATLLKSGKVVNKCSVCGYVKSTTTIYYPKTIKLSSTSYTYNGKVKTPAVTVKNSIGNTLKKDTDYTVKYASGRKNTGKYAVTITFKGNYSGTKTLYFNILPSKTSNITTTRTTTSIKAAWNKVTGASGYKVELLNSNGKVLKTVTTTKLTCSFINLSKATTYKVRVTAYKTIDGKKVYSTVSTTLITSTSPAKVTLNKVTAGSKIATLTWNTVSGASGYEIRYATSSQFKSAKTVTVSTGSSKKTTIKNLTTSKKYYFKVRAYKTVGGKKVYGAWSSVKSVKVK